MAQIIRGTTPTIEFTFSTVSVSDIVVADLTIKQGETAVIEKDITAATVGASSISWLLSQEDTLTFKSVQPLTIGCDWKTDEGLRGRSNILTASVGEPGKNEVI